MLPDGSTPDTESTPNEDSIRVKILTAIQQVKIDDEELMSALREYHRSSGIIAKDHEARVGIQQSVLDWINWLVVMYPKLKRTIDANLRLVGYEFGEIPEGVTKFNDLIHPEEKTT
jgi:hypothetical protein